MDEDILDRIQNLNDAELTILACMVAGEHAIFTTTTDADLEAELALCLKRSFDIQAATLLCSARTSSKDFNHAVLSNSQARSDPYHLMSDETFLDDRDVTSVVILSHLDLASEEVQVQVIDLLRTRRVYTRSAMHTAPKDFLLLITLSRPDARLSYHLNDMLAVSHDFDLNDRRFNDSDSLLISHTEVDHLRSQALKARLTAEVDAYLYNIVLYMRMSRYVQGGVSATATRQMRVLSKALAALHGIDFITPSIVMLAARKIYPHRLVLASASTEKSLQWGSDPGAVRKLLDDATIGKVIEEVIASVDTPL